MGARRFSFPRDDGSGKMEGTTLYYLDPQNQAKDEDLDGLFPFQVNGTPSMFHQLPALPGEYDLKMERRPGARGKATEVLVGLEFVGEVSFGEAYAAPSE